MIVIFEWKINYTVYETRINLYIRTLLTFIKIFTRFTIEYELIVVIIPLLLVSYYGFKFLRNLNLLNSNVSKDQLFSFKLLSKVLLIFSRVNYLQIKCSLYLLNLFLFLRICFILFIFIIRVFDAFGN